MSKARCLQQPYSSLAAAMEAHRRRDLMRSSFPADAAIGGGRLRETGQHAGEAAGDACSRMVPGPCLLCQHGDHAPDDADQADQRGELDRRHQTRPVPDDRAASRFDGPISCRIQGDSLRLNNLSHRLTTVGPMMPKRAKATRLHILKPLLKS